MAFTCPVCGRTSHHPKDEEYGWCSACSAYTGKHDLAAHALNGAFGLPAPNCSRCEAEERHGTEVAGE